MSRMARISVTRKKLVTVKCRVAFLSRRFCHEHHNGRLGNLPYLFAKNLGQTFLLSPLGQISPL